MPILEPKKKNPDNKFVGVFLPPQLYNYLTLYIWAKDTDKSKVIRSLMESWIERHAQKDSEEQLIHEIVRRIEIEWANRRNSIVVTTFVSFKREIEYELIDKQLSKEHISLILEELERNEKNRKGRTT
jgi:hypothetical protein